MHPLPQPLLLPLLLLRDDLNRLLATRLLSRMLDASRMIKLKRDRRKRLGDNDEPEEAERVDEERRFEGEAKADEDGGTVAGVACGTSDAFASEGSANFA